MTHRFAELMFTPVVQAVQSEQGSREAYARFARPEAPGNDRFAEREAAFIAARDSLYMASVSETGWPYVQHRGGPPGFIKVLDDRTLGFADYRGNRQYVTVGNLRGDDRVSIFLMDYPNRRRLKILGHARIVDPEDRATLARLRDDYDARVERGMIVTLEGFDWNCPQHITPRFTEAELAEALAPIRWRRSATGCKRSSRRMPSCAAGSASILEGPPTHDHALQLSAVRQRARGARPDSTNATPSSISTRQRGRAILASKTGYLLRRECRGRCKMRKTTSAKWSTPLSVVSPKW